MATSTAGVLTGSALGIEDNAIDGVRVHGVTGLDAVHIRLRAGDIPAAVDQVLGRILLGAGNLHAGELVSTGDVLAVVVEVLTNHHIVILLNIGGDLLVGIFIGRTTGNNFVRGNVRNLGCIDSGQNRSVNFPVVVGINEGNFISGDVVVDRTRTVELFGRQHRQSQPQSWGPQALFRQYKR